MTLSYPKAIEYLYGLQWHGIKLGLDTIRRLMTVLNEPHRRFRSVHIAGTNGKGSTAAMVATILATAGYRTGLYTSPHLIDFTERICVNGEPIPRKAAAGLTGQIRDAAAGTPVTFFEFTTAMAFLYFADSAVDFVVAEVGMGGRYDATNVLTPLVSVITPIDFDHQAYLGDTIERIAAEKAGIIKPSVPVVTAADRPEAVSVIRTVCREQNAPLYRLGFEVRVEGVTPQRFSYQGIHGSLADLNCSLLGRHQLSNAGCALAVLELLEQTGISIGEEAVRRGLSSVRWEGRLEPMPPAPSGAAVILDGAHNPAGARVLRTFLKESRPSRPGRLILVVGILRDKDIDGILGELVPIADEVIVTRPRYERAASADDLKRHIEKYGVRVTVREPLEDALRYAQSVAAAADRICITGSLYTVGEARSYLKGLAQPSALRG
ncbi:MAG: bifunctional folylpolyglutamate synthase/dihydrofolate synthase [Nitrospirae bacterium]|nr:bifunctional folylpolyglutamate synthase/dihydrofolate synthase [Nitrospirota bacterium]